MRVSHHISMKLHHIAFKDHQSFSIRIQAFTCKEQSLYHPQVSFA